MKEFFESIKNLFLESKEDLKDIFITLSGFILLGLVIIIGLALVLTLLAWSNADSSFSFITAFKESFGYALFILLFAFIYFLFHSGALTFGTMLLLIPLLFFSNGGELAAVLIVVGCIYWLVFMFSSD